MSFNILGMGTAFPKRQVTNDELSLFLDTSDEWIYSRTGIKSRHVSTGESLVDISTDAARVALENAGIEVDKLDLIIVSTMGGDYYTPSHACMVQKALGATCPAFDMNAACTGYVYALDIAAAYMDSGRAEHVLVVSAELMSSIIDWKDRATCVLFGDGAAATVLKKGDGLLYSKLTASGDDEALVSGGPVGNNPFETRKKRKPYISMDGGAIFKFAVSTLTKGIPEALEKCGLTMGDIKAIVPHQANGRIIAAATKMLAGSEGKFVVDLEDYGNTSSASLPIALSNMMARGELDKGDNIALCAFGGGLTTGVCIIKI